MSGVYTIVNKINNKTYIGSAVDFKVRQTRHFTNLRKDKHHCIALQRSWNKYGEENFEFRIIEKCSASKCVEREQYYIDLLKPEYNSCKIAGSSLGYKFTKQQIEKLKQIRKNQEPKHGKPVFMFDLNLNLIGSFVTAVKAEIATGISRKLISRCCKGETKRCKGFIFKFSNAE